jgi:hypothetical protein
LVLLVLVLMRDTQPGGKIHSRNLADVPILL